MINDKRWLKKSELEKIKQECDDECCNPCAEEMHWYAAQRLEYERKRLVQHDKDSERRRIPITNSDVLEKEKPVPRKCRRLLRCPTIS